MKKHKDHPQFQYMMMRPLVVRKWPLPPPGGDPRAQEPRYRWGGGTTYTFHTPTGRNLGRLVLIKSGLVCLNSEWTFDPAVMTYGVFSYMLTQEGSLTRRETNANFIEILTRAIKFALAPPYPDSQYEWTQDGLTLRCRIISGGDVVQLRRSPYVKLDDEMMALYDSLINPLKKARHAKSPSPHKVRVLDPHERHTYQHAARPRDRVRH